MSKHKTKRQHAWTNYLDGTGFCRTCGMHYRIKMRQPSLYSTDGGESWEHRKKVPPCPEAKS